MIKSDESGYPGGKKVMNLSGQIQNIAQKNRQRPLLTGGFFAFFFLLCTQCFGSVFLFFRIRIRIQRLRLETNTDPDPDPIRIQAFNDQKLKKNYS
jgi:hypothetical protein